MPIFTAAGGHHQDNWLVDGSPEFSIFPGNTIAEFSKDIPIHLKVGNKVFGASHIEDKHWHWLRKQGFESGPHLVHHKLSQPGSVYCTEVDTKFKIMMQLKPSALLVMEYKERSTPHFSVTTLYLPRGTLDGTVVGRYPGRRR